MKTLGRWLVVVALVLAAVVGVLYLLVPANKTAADGPADPIRSLRRPIVKALIWAGIVEGPGWFGGHPYLPTVGGSDTSEKDPAGEDIPTSQMRIEMEPVYRGLLWPIGDRITYRLKLFGDYREIWRAVRLCYNLDGERFVAAENATPDPGGQLAEVSGYVPRSARGYWIERTDDKGEIHAIDGWGDTDTHSRD